MTIKSWYKWQANVYKTTCIECKDRRIYIYKDDKLLNCSFNEDDSVELLIERDSVCLSGFNVHHHKENQKYTIKRVDIVKVKY